MTNKTLVRVRVWVRSWIKIYIRHTENTKLLPNSATSLKYTVVIIYLKDIGNKFFYFRY